MATHSSVLAWRIPGTGEPGGLPSMGSHTAFLKHKLFSYEKMYLKPSSPVPMEKAMAPYSSTLAWKIPWTEEPGGLQSMGSLRFGHD